MWARARRRGAARPTRCGRAGRAAAAPRGRPFEFETARTPVVTDVSPPSGMAGQVITITGERLDAAFAVDDENWYMDEFGFYTQTQPVVVYVGDNPTEVLTSSATEITAMVIYNQAEVEHPVKVWVHGKGRAATNGTAATFTYGLYLFSIAPLVGSVEGGTTVTLTGSGFATTMAFYADETNNEMGSSMATYHVHFGATELGGSDGTDCVVNKASQYAMECVTQPASAATPLDDGTIQTHVEVAWNYEPFYFYCGRPPAHCSPPGCAIDEARNATRRCHFAFTQASTPRLERISNGNVTFRGKPETDIVVPGDTLVFKLVPACEPDAASGGAPTCLDGLAATDSFDWMRWVNETAGTPQRDGARRPQREAACGPARLRCRPARLCLSSRRTGLRGRARQRDREQFRARGRDPTCALGSEVRRKAASARAARARGCATSATPNGTARRAST